MTFLDTHSGYKQLVEAGVPEAQASALVNVYSRFAAAKFANSESPSLDREDGIQEMRNRELALRREMRQEIQSLRKEVRDEIAALRREVRESARRTRY